MQLALTEMPQLEKRTQAVSTGFTEICLAILEGLPATASVSAPPVLAASALKICCLDMLRSMCEVKAGRDRLFSVKNGPETVANCALRDGDAAVRAAAAGALLAVTRHGEGRQMLVKHPKAVGTMVAAVALAPSVMSAVAALANGEPGTGSSTLLLSVGCMEQIRRILSGSGIGRGSGTETYSPLVVHDTLSALRVLVQDDAGKVAALRAGIVCAELLLAHLKHASSATRVIATGSLSVISVLLEGKQALLEAGDSFLSQLPVLLRDSDTRVMDNLTITARHVAEITDGKIAVARVLKGYPDLYIRVFGSTGFQQLIDLLQSDPDTAEASLRTLQEACHGLGRPGVVALADCLHCAENLSACALGVAPPEPEADVWAPLTDPESQSRARRVLALVLEQGPDLRACVPDDLLFDLLAHQGAASNVSSAPATASASASGAGHHIDGKDSASHHGSVGSRRRSSAVLSAAPPLHPQHPDGHADEATASVGVRGSLASVAHSTTGSANLGSAVELPGRSTRAGSVVSRAESTSGSGSGAAVAAVVGGTKQAASAAPSRKASVSSAAGG
jgi:hypothetical protein